MRFFCVWAAFSDRTFGGIGFCAVVCCVAKAKAASEGTNVSFNARA